MYRNKLTTEDSRNFTVNPQKCQGVTHRRFRIQMNFRKTLFQVRDYIGQNMYQNKLSLDDSRSCTINLQK